MSASALFDGFLEWDRKRLAAIQRREELATLKRQATPHCGDCYYWMKSRDCPRERNVNGMSRGPSSGGLPCVKFLGTASFNDSCAKYAAALQDPRP